MKLVDDTSNEHALDNICTKKNQKSNCKMFESTLVDKDEISHKKLDKQLFTKNKPWSCMLGLFPLLSSPSLHHCRKGHFQQLYPYFYLS